MLSVGYKKHAEMDSVIVAIISHNSQLTTTTMGAQNY